MRCLVIAWPIRPTPTMPIFSLVAMLHACSLCPRRHVRLQRGRDKGTPASKCGPARTDNRNGHGEAEMQSKKLMLRVALFVGATGIAVAASGAALSQSNYPSRPVRI